MGIKFLNKILRDNCDQSIWQISIKELTGKKIAVDISADFTAQNIRIENGFYVLAGQNQKGAISKQKIVVNK